MPAHVETPGQPSAIDSSKERSKTHEGLVADTWPQLSPSEIEHLPRVADKIPAQVWSLIIVSTAERFCFYGLREPFQNYLQNKYDDPLRPGALGLGQRTASDLSYAFSFLCYIMPLFVGIVIDCYLGRLRGLLVCGAFYLTGVMVLMVTSIPRLLEAGAGLPGWIVAACLISIGIGGVRSAMAPMIADQYSNLADRVVYKRSGKHRLATRELTIDRIYHAYYWAVNLGALSALATTYIEKDVGFWAAYLLPFCTLCFAGVTLWLCRKKIVAKPPSGNILSKVFRVFLCASKNGFRLDAARPRNQVGLVDWNDNFITDLQRGLVACRVFAVYPILWVCHLQINNNLVSQAAQMETGGLPNDWFPTINPIAVLALLPVVSNGLYPLLRMFKIPFPPINKIAIGFLIEAAAIAYCAGIQKWIYSSEPCFEYALECAASNGGRLPNHVNAWAQTPTYVLDGLSEVFWDVVGQEYAYNKAPASMKSVVQGILWSMSGLGAVLGFALNPVTRNPLLVWMYTGLAAVMGVTAVGFWLIFHKYNKVDAQLDKQEPDEDLFDPNELP